MSRNLNQQLQHAISETFREGSSKHEYRSEEYFEAKYFRIYKVVPHVKKWWNDKKQKNIKIDADEEKLNRSTI